MRGNFRNLGLGAAGGLLSGMLVLAVYFVGSATAKGADGGDWLAFAGVVFGVIATIGGTLAIDQIKAKITHRRAIRNLTSALDIWSDTVPKIPIDLSKALLGDLLQQHAYISTIAADISRDARAATMATHAFSFHVPSMIHALENALTEQQGAAQAIMIGHVTNELTSYTATLRGALAVT